MKKFEIHICERYEPDEGWITAAVEDPDGALLASVTAPVVEGATFDIRAAVIRDAVEKALGEGGSNA